jgi:site-specific DNA-methyltransferase (adenine-specific)
MFSFVGDTVVDPFSGSGTTMVAAMKAGRNSIGIEIDSEYCKMAEDRLREENSDVFSTATLEFIYPAQTIESRQTKIAVGEKRVKYSIRKKKIVKPQS